MRDSGFRSETLRFGRPGEASDDSTSDDLRLIPGASVGDGRYRLLLWHGGLEHLQFWQALDTTLHRQVALTLVDPDGRLPDEQIQAIVSRTLSLSRLDMPGMARVLQVVRAAPGAIVVAEWIRGATLAEVADTDPSPVGAARAMRSLAAAAEAAHRGGTALSIDHPSRVRVSIEGHVALAFPATMPDATRGGRPARHRRLPLRAAGRPLAAPPARGAQRSGPRAGRDRSPAERPHGHRRRYSFPNLGRRDGLVAGVRRDPQRHNASEHAGAGHRRSRSGRMRHPRADGLPCAAAPFACDAPAQPLADGGGSWHSPGPADRPRRGRGRHRCGGAAGGRGAEPHHGSRNYRHLPRGSARPSRRRRPRRLSRPRPAAAWW